MNQATDEPRGPAVPQPQRSGPGPAAAPAMTPEDELYWLALRMVPGLGTRRTGLLLERLRTPRAVFRASAAELEAAGVSGALAQSIASGCSFDDAAGQQSKMRETGTRLVTLGDAE